MILVEDRQIIAERISQAHARGARLKAACELAGVDVRTLQRWKRGGLQRGDQRPHVVRASPSHALTTKEREQILQVANEPRFAELPAARIVPMLADGRTALAEGLHALKEKPVLHGDNGATMKATTVLAMLNWLGIKASYSRPRVSDDNAFVESLFRTAKYRPQFPSSGFAAVEDARQWASDFVTWYNHDHLHSGIRYVSPAQRHAGEDRDILARRHTVYLEARQANPQRWSRHTRNWDPIDAVTLNPEKESVVDIEIVAAKVKASAT
jgi:transposase InsO family protein